MKMIFFNQSSKAKIGNPNFKHMVIELLFAKKSKIVSFYFRDQKLWPFDGSSLDPI